MSDEKDKLARNCLSVMQTHALIEELKKPSAQEIIDANKFDRVGFAKHLSVALGFKVTRGNLYDPAKTLGLKFHHPNDGLRPGTKRQPTFEDVMMPVGRHELAELRTELRNLAMDLGRGQSRAAAIDELKEDVKEYGRKVHTTHDTLNGRMLEQEQRVADKLIELLGKFGSLETRVVRQSDRLSEALKQIESMKKFLETEFKVSIPSA